MIQHSFLVAVISIINHTFLYLLISWIGQLYVKSEVSRVNNELILDNLDDGLIIIEKYNGQLVFSNKKAKRLNIDFNQKFFSTSLNNKFLSFFESEKKQFAKLDVDSFKMAKDST